MAEFFDSILGNLDLSNIEKKTVSLNQSKRLPVIVLADISDSMKDYEYLLKEAVEKLYEIILFDRTISNSVEISVMTFNNKIKILEHMCEIKAQKSMGKNLDFSCCGSTLMGLALKEAIIQIEGRKKIYLNSVPRLRYYSPILFLFSDGKPECYDNSVKPQENDAMDFSKTYIKRAVVEDKLNVFSIEIGNCCNHTLMRELTGLDSDKHIIKVNNASELTYFFRWALCPIKMS